MIRFPAMRWYETDKRYYKAVLGPFVPKYTLVARACATQKWFSASLHYKHPIDT